MTAAPTTGSTPIPEVSTGLGESRVVITGGSTGIGLATARRLVAMGADVVLASRSPDKLSAARDSLGVGPSRVETAVVDVTDAEQVKRFFDGVGPFDHLFTSAGEQAIDAPFAQLPEATARRIFEVKYWGQYRAVAAAAPVIRAGGSITMVSAWLARKPTAGFPTYAAVDGAVEALARVLSLELAPLRVNVLSPGVIATPLYDNLEPQVVESTVAAVSARLPLGRIGTADECAQAVLYLMGNGYSTGAVVDVDGGWA